MEFKSLLTIKNLHVSIDLGHTVVKAVDGANIDIRENEILGLIGESGSGKSVLGLAILKLLPPNATVDGEVWFDGANLVESSEEEMRRIRGKEIAWIPQDPATSLNPVLKVGFQISEPMVLHTTLDKEQVRQKTISLLDFFDIQPPERRAEEYPYQYSGGMRQRALIAMGTSTNPKLLIADEPTKGVDTPRKAQVAAMFRRIKRENPGLSILLITHDLRFAQALCDRIAVMYCAQIIEVTPAQTFFEAPLHPYSEALLEALPSRGLKQIPGDMPSMITPPGGCRFHPRCRYARPECRHYEPPFSVIDGTLVRCWRYA